MDNTNHGTWKKRKFRMRLYFILHYFMCISVFPSSVYAYYVCCLVLSGVRKGALGPLEMELQVVVSQRVGAGNRT